VVTINSVHPAVALYSSRRLPGIPGPCCRPAY
jgi:hypothetical protein